MFDWMTQVLETTALGPAMLPAAFLMGLVSSAGCSCNLAVIGLLAGYSGSLSQQENRRDILVGGLFFMVGTILALGLMGAVTGVVSDLASTALGTYWKIFAGLLALFIGLMGLKLLPFRLPAFRTKHQHNPPRGIIRSTLFGAGVGGATIIGSLCCNPVLLVVLGMAAAKGQALWGAAILAAYGIGYSLPGGATLVGLGLGLKQLSLVINRAAPVIKVVTGALLVAVGFYLLGTA